jgi:hypothetical protein
MRKLEYLIRQVRRPMSPIFCIRLPFAAKDVQQICGERAWS